MDPHLELFQTGNVNDLELHLQNKAPNIKIAKIIGHKRLRNDVICKWEHFPNKDATYSTTDDFKSSSYNMQLVKKYVFDFDECPNELRIWIKRMDWIRKEIQNEWRMCDEIVENFLNALYIHIDARGSPKRKKQTFSEE